MKRLFRIGPLSATAALFLIVCLAGSKYRERVPEPPETGAEPEQRITIVAAGDIMMHMPEVNAAYSRELDDYAFAPFFSEITPILQQADFAVANLETNLANEVKYTGFPRFNSPQKLAADLKEAGFDLLVTANNHAFDHGETGVRSTLAALRKAELTAVGTRSGDGERPYAILEKNGIRIGFLAYTCPLNGFSLPPEKPYLVSLFSPEQLRKDLLQVRQMGVDLIVSYVHFGHEYHRTPSSHQREVVEIMQKEGVAVIFGAHPHVVQPAVFAPERNQYTAFSLGNLISNQHSDFTDVGLLAAVTLRRDRQSGKVVLHEVEHTPSYVSRYWQDGKKIYRVKTAVSADTHLTRKYCAAQQCPDGFYRQFMAHVQAGMGDAVSMVTEEVAVVAKK